MNKVVLVTLSLLPMWAAAAPKTTPASVAAAKAVSTISNIQSDSGDPGMQGAIARTELAEPAYGLPPKVRETFKTLARTDPRDRMMLVAAVVDEFGGAFIKEACTTTDLRVLFKMSVDDVVKACHLKERKLAPANLAPTLRPGSMLLSAFLVDDMTKRKASEPEIALARWVAHADRTDEEAKTLKQP